VDKAKADDQRHAGERQHHHLQVRKAVGGKQRKIVRDTLPKDVPLLLHDDRRADLDAVIEIDHVLIGHANAAR
jgi:hypothetical protein